MNSKIKKAVETQLGEKETIHLPELLDDAFIGIARQFNIPFAVYDRKKCIELIQKDMGGSVDEAEEYFFYHISYYYVGGGTPAFIDLSSKKPKKVERLEV
jgi:hypothetical protein